MSETGNGAKASASDSPETKEALVAQKAAVDEKLREISQLRSDTVSVLVEAQRRQLDPSDVTKVKALASKLRKGEEGLKEQSQALQAKLEQLGQQEQLEK